MRRALLQQMKHQLRWHPKRFLFYFPAPDPNAKFAAGRDALVVGLSTQGILQRWNLKTFERQATDFEELLTEPGLGPKALRSLSLIAEVICQAPASRRDPA